MRKEHRFSSRSLVLIVICVAINMIALACGV
jgi:energy-coupling factor transport system substrate-specific component